MKLFKAKSKSTSQKKNIEKLDLKQMKNISGGGDEATDRQGGNKGAGLMLTIPLGR